MPSPSVSLITLLADARRTRKTGVKAANLSRLIAAHFAVPRGFVISSDAYRAHLWASGARDLATAFAEAEDREQVRTSILSQPIPNDISNAVLKAYDQLSLQIGDRNPKVAVRPSAEEPEAADFPGAYESFINVSGEEALLSAVRRVWASLWSGKAAAFRARTLSATEGRVPSSAEGRVLSTVEGRACEPAMAVIVQQMVEVSVSGTASTANPVTGDPRKVTVSFATDRAEAARVEIDLAGPTARDCSIPAEVALAAERSVLAEEVCGGPVEVEWAFDRDTFWVLQLRPLKEDVIAFPVPDGLEEGSEWRLLSRGPVSPFYGSLLQWKPTGSLPSPPRDWGGARMVVNGYVYARVATAARGQSPSLAEGTKALQRWRQQVGPILTRRCRELLGADLAQAGWSSLLRALTEAAGAVVAASRWLDAAPYPASRFPAMVREAIEDDPLFYRLMSGLDSPVVLRDARLQQLAEKFAHAEQAGQVTSPDWWRDYKAEVLEFTRDYGWAVPDEAATCDCASWRNDMDSVFQLISALSRIDQRPSLITRHCAAQQDAAEALPNGIRPDRRFSRVLALARDWLAAREESEMALALAMSALSTVSLELGERLRTAGMIADAGDVFQLTLGELLGVSAQPAAEDRTAYARLVARRKHEFWLDSRLLPPETLPRKDAAKDASGSGTSGIGVSPGVTVGVARCIDSILGENGFRLSDILVVDGSGSAWTPLLAIAGGLVTVNADELSTAAVLAREYGIPAVTGCPAATASALNGKLVTVNGSDGSVEIGRRTTA